MKRVAQIVLSALALTAVVAVGAVWYSGDVRSRSGAETQDSAASDFGGSFSLTDQYGKRRTDLDFRKKYMLIFFGYTYCPDVCPTTLAIEAEALDKIGARASQIVPIFVTVDPKKVTAGNFSGSIEIETNDAKVPRLKVPVSITVAE